MLINILYLYYTIIIIITLVLFLLFHTQNYNMYALVYALLLLLFTKYFFLLKDSYI